MKLSEVRLARPIPVGNSVRDVIRWEHASIELDTAGRVVRVIALGYDAYEVPLENVVCYRRLGGGASALTDAMEHALAYASGDTTKGKETRVEVDIPAPKKGKRR